MLLKIRNDGKKILKIRNDGKNSFKSRDFPWRCERATAAPRPHQGSYDEVHVPHILVDGCQVGQDIRLYALLEVTEVGHVESLAHVEVVHVGRQGVVAAWERVQWETEETARHFLYPLRSLLFEMTTCDGGTNLLLRGGLMTDNDNQPLLTLSSPV